MPGPEQHRPPQSQPDRDGVRVIARKEAAGLWARGLPLAALMLAGGLAYWLLGIDPEKPSPESRTPSAGVQAPSTAATHAAAAPTSGRARPAPTAASSHHDAGSMPDEDPDASDDLAAYFRPGDQEPTAAELIEALNHAGIRTGIGAFNPPGTSPPLAGLAVPEDFDLPEGYVRHHQVTDQGEELEPILMFSPDFEFHDALGRLVAIPEDRVVPPELAPPGLPIRQMVPPKP